ncbi:MAG: hypothetical protein K2J74_01275 [Muribaculaceae bacterium]|nr:hypothetical protein [Muribaculaceae bacterium]
MTIQDIKQNLYAYRNGVVADSLRKSGDPHHIIFGLLLPQLSEIALLIGKDKAIATELWSQRTSRECRLLAPMVYPPEDLSPSLGKEMIAEALNKEEIDILCFKLLSRTPCAQELANEMIQCSSGNDNFAYAAPRLILNLMAQGKITDKESVLQQLSPLSATSVLSVKQMLEQINEH